MPMVVMKEGVKESSLKRSRQQDLPTPESPMRRSFICEVWLVFFFWERAGGGLGGELEMVGDVRGSHNCVYRPCCGG